MSVAARNTTLGPTKAPALGTAWLPGVVLAVGLAVSAFLWRSLAAQQAAVAGAALEFGLKAATDGIETSLRAQVSALTRAGGWWRELDGTPERAWQRDAFAIQRDFPALTGLQWIDRDFHVRWDTAHPGGMAAAAQATGLLAREQDSARRAEAEDRPVLVLLPPNGTDGPYLDILMPLNSRIAFDGWMRATLDFRRLAEEERQHLNLASRLQIYSAGALVLETGDPVDGAGLAASAPLEVLDLKLEARLRSAAAPVRSALPAGVFVAGAAVSLMLAALARQFVLLVNRKRELQASQSAVEAQRAHIDVVYRAAPVGLCLLDTETRFIHANERMARIYGKTPGELTGRTPREIDAVLGERFEPFLKYVLTMESALENVEILLDSEPADAIGMEESSPRAWLCSFHPSHDAAGRVNGIVGAVLDISSLKDAEAEKGELAAQLFLAQKTEALGRLTGGIAHDFNNMLGVILGSLEFLREPPPDPHHKTLLDRIELAAEHSADLVRRLLAFARQQPLTPRNVDLVPSLKNLLPLFEKSLGESVEIRTVFAPDCWVAKVDESQLGSALLNLIINARDAMPGGGRITIEVSNAVLDEDSASGGQDVTPGEYVSLVVSDTGTGMSREVLARAFEPFFTTKEAGRGSGLGLSMVFGFIKQSRGHIMIYSEPGHGTTVKLYLPRGADDLPAPDAAPAEVICGNESLLVVEDDALIRETAIRQLSSLGYRVTAASGGAQALDILKQRGDFDLLLTDVVMPGGMNGLALATAALAANPRLKILFMSGFTDSAITDDWLAAGALLLQKPYRRADLAAKVHRALTCGPMRIPVAR